jgi:hypothetical protein
MRHPKGDEAEPEGPAPGELLAVAQFLDCDQVNA